MKKKILLLSTLAVMTMVSGAFAGCSCSCNSNSNEQAEWVELDMETLMMTLGDEKSLLADYAYQADANLRYVSSNESVVKVDEYGRLTAMSEGTATITVYYGEATDTCAVTVSMNGLLPLLQLKNVPTNEVSIYKSTELDLDGQVLFNGKTYDDVTLTYEISDETVGNVENGVFKPLKSGKTEVLIKAQWRGIADFSMQKTITIEVVPEMIFAVNEGASEIILYTQTDIVSPFVITAEYDGVPFPTTAEVTVGGDYVVYDEVAQTVKSRGLTGEAEITVSYELNGEVTIKKIPVYVKPTVYEYETTVTNFSAIHGDTAVGRPLNVILGADIVSAQDENGNSLEVKDNKVFGVQSSKDGKFETTITIFSKTHGYKINLEGYSSVFAKAEDFSVFYLNARYGYKGDKQEEGESKKFHPIDENKPIARWEGYYVLANNIDASNYDHATTGVALATRGLQSSYTYGFFGTFDGQGYTVKGMSVGAAGIFGYLVDATVKNVAFVDVTLREEANAATLSAWILNSTVSNVYVSIANDGVQTVGGSAFACGANASSFAGCVVETKEGFGYQDGLTYSGSFTYQNKERYDGDSVQSTFADVFVISSEPLGYFKTGKYYLQAENETFTPGEGFSVFTLEGVKRYDTLAQMQSANNTYSYLDKTYWTIENGAPVWKSLNGDYPTEDELVDNTKPENVTVNDFDENWL